MTQQRQLSDCELKGLAVRHLGAKAARYVEFIETTDFSVATGAKATMTPYDTKLFLLLAAADFGGRPH